MPTQEEVQLCKKLIKKKKLGKLNGFPPRQGYRSIVCYVYKDGVVKVVKISKDSQSLEAEIKQLKALEKIALTTAKVPRLLDYDRRSTGYILMTRLSGETCEEKWRLHGPLSSEETRRIGTLTGIFMAEMHQKTGRIYDDLHPNNMLLGRKRGQLKIVDWGQPLVKCPTSALLRLLWRAPNLVPPAAATFHALTGIAIDPDLAKLRAQNTFGHDCPEAVRHISANVDRWKEVIAGSRPQILPTGPSAHF